MLTPEYGHLGAIPCCCCCPHQSCSAFRPVPLVVAPHEKSDVENTQQSKKCDAVLLFKCLPLLPWPLNLSYPVAQSTGSCRQKRRAAKVLIREQQQKTTNRSCLLSSQTLALVCPRNGGGEETPDDGQKETKRRSRKHKDSTEQTLIGRSSCC